MRLGSIVLIATCKWWVLWVHLIVSLFVLIECMSSFFCLYVLWSSEGVSGNESENPVEWWGYWKNVKRCSWNRKRGKENMCKQKGDDIKRRWLMKQYTFYRNLVHNAMKNMFMLHVNYACCKYSLPSSHFYGK